MFSSKKSNQHKLRAGCSVMANILLSCWEYSRYHKQVLPVTGFWQFDRIVDSKIGFNPPFHFHVFPRINLVLAALNKQLFTTNEQRGHTILLILIDH